MNLSRLYSHIPTKDGQSLLNDLADVYTQQLGSNGETITLVSYFQKDLHLGPELPLITNKYALFVENGNQQANNTFQWTFTLRDVGGTAVTSQHQLSEINKGTQEYIFLLEAAAPFDSLEGFTIEVACQSTLQGQQYNLSLSHTLYSISTDISDLAQGNNNAALGNPECTYFIANHMRNYIRDIGNIRVGYINLALAVFYKKILDHLDQLKVMGVYRNIYSLMFSDRRLEYRINNAGDYSTLSATETGITSIKLPILRMLFDPDNNFVRDADLDNLMQQGLTSEENLFIGLYHLSVFPKSAIKYATEILKMLFEKFVGECDPGGANYIYNTLQSGPPRMNLLNSWLQLTSAELNLSNLLISNILVEYHYGPKSAVGNEELEKSFWTGRLKILKHDWAPYVDAIIGYYQVCPIDPNVRSHFVIHCTAGNMSETSIKNDTGITSNNRLRSMGHVYVMDDGTTIEVWPFTEKNVWATKIESQQNLRGRMFHVELNYGSPDVPTENQYHTLAKLYILASNIEDGWPIIVPHIEVDRGIDDGHSDPTDFNYNHFYSILKEMGVPIDNVTKFDHDRYWGDPTYKVPWKSDTTSWPPILTGNPH